MIKNFVYYCGMENLTLSKFKKTVEQLRQMKVNDDLALTFPINKYKTVTGTAWRLKKEGMRFITRKHECNVYIWRIA
ncbi:hypothetical protein D3C80_1529500 [compost metagenome]